MQDEQYMRSWNDSHSRFSAEIDQALGRLASRFPRRTGRRKAIGNPYGIPAELKPSGLSPAARASLRGLAASVLTVTLWIAVMALATPTPGLAAPVSSMAGAECVAYPFLA